MFKNAVELSHFYLKNTIQQGATVVDATCGNGKDTVFLASLIGENGQLFAFDIQACAIRNTKDLLCQYGFCVDSKKMNFIIDGHENMNLYLPHKPIDAFVFNLGYLPKGDHTLHTKADTTIQALQIALDYLGQNGIILISIYHGGDSGFEEKNAVLRFLEQLDCRRYNVIIHHYSNKPNHPPILAVITHN